MDKSSLRRLWPKFLSPKGGQIYIIPTRVGLYHVAGSVLGMIFTLSYANALAIFSIFLWFCFLLSTALTTHRSLRAILRVSPWRDLRWREDQAVPLTSTYQVSGVQLWLRMEGSDKEMLVDHKLRLNAGVYRVTNQQVVATIPFGIFRACSTHEILPHELVVLPCARDYAVAASAGRSRAGEAELENQHGTPDSHDPGIPVELGASERMARMHWRRSAFTQRPVGLRPDLHTHARDFLEWSSLTTLTPLERSRQVMFEMSRVPVRWQGVRLQDGRLMLRSEQLAVELAYLVSTVTSSELA